MWYINIAVLGISWVPRPKFWRKGWKLRPENAKCIRFLMCCNFCCRLLPKPYTKYTSMANWGVKEINTIGIVCRKWKRITAICATRILSIHCTNIKDWNIKGVLQMHFAFWIISIIFECNLYESTDAFFSTGEYTLWRLSNFILSYLGQTINAVTMYKWLNRPVFFSVVSNNIRISWKYWYNKLYM